MKSKILFLCPYGGAKSVIAATYFNQLAESKHLPYVVAAAAAETPYDAVPETIVALLGDELKSFKPHHVDAAELASAARVVSIDCDLAPLDTRGVTIEKWDDVPKVSVDLPASAAAIRKHVEELVNALTSGVRQR